jgi:hypothetical protein
MIHIRPYTPSDTRKSLLRPACVFSSVLDILDHSTIKIAAVPSGSLPQNREKRSWTKGKKIVTLISRQINMDTKVLPSAI